jgi:hypothetical protein
MMPNRERIRANVQAALTEDLLDRITVYREGMEPDAVALIEEELQRRGIGAEAITAHAERRRQGAVLCGADGLPLRCARCPRPAVGQTWQWHRLWGVLPVFPRRMAFCEEHRPS